MIARAGGGPLQDRDGDRNCDWNFDWNPGSGEGVFFRRARWCAFD
jgi:hypothetical protein